MSRTMQFGVQAGLERRNNVVLFEGPGPDVVVVQEEDPVHPRGGTKWSPPIVKRVRARDDVGSVAVVGISFGGMLCARVAARTPVDAVVLQPRAYSFPRIVGRQKDVDLVPFGPGRPGGRTAQGRRG